MEIVRNLTNKVEVPFRDVKMGDIVRFAGDTALYYKTELSKLTSCNIPVNAVNLETGRKYIGFDKLRIAEYVEVMK